MLQAIVEFSIRNRVVVLVLAALLLAGGFYAAQHARLDVFPEFTPPQAIVQTEAPGRSAPEVEQLVTLPIEQALNGIARLDVLRSQSIQGLSVVTAIFTDGTDIYRARQQVSERLAELGGQLPTGVKPPRIAPLTTATGRLLSIGFTSEKLSPLQLRDRVQWTIRPRLLAVKGIAQVTLFGGEVRQFQVQVRPDALAARNLTLTDVVDAARQATGIRGAGFLEGESQRLTLRVEGQVHSADELGEAVVVNAGGTPVRLHDVARVVEAAEPKFGDASINGVSGVILIAYKQFDADTVETTRLLEAELERLRPSLALEDISYHPALFRQATFIDHAIGNVTRSLLIGAAMVAVVLFFFLFNLRTAIISLTAIPLSLLGAVLTLWAWGVSLNTLTLGGLAIAVGEVVDDAIIDVENIYRRLRENARLAHPRSAPTVVLAASLEVRSSVVYATFLVALVFVPIFFLTGLHGRLFAPLGYAYVLAVMMSLAVALTVTPALSLLLLPRATGAAEPPPLRLLQGGYERLLRRLDREFPLLLSATLVLLLAACWAILQFGGQFLPELRESHFVVHMRGLPGTSLRQSIASGNQITEVLRKNPAVAGVAQQAGRAELGEDTWGVDYSELEVDLHPAGAGDIAQVERSIKETLRARAGYSFEVMPFLTERIKETISGSPASVAVKVYGDDLEAIDRAAQDTVGILAAIPGSINVHAEAQMGSPELVIRVRQRDAGRYGLRSGQIVDALHAAYQGAEIGQVYERNRVIDVVVILDPKARTDADTIANLWLAVSGADPRGQAGSENGADGPGRSPGAASAPAVAGRVQLKQLADVFVNDGRWLIAHEGGVRRQVVTCNFSGRDVESFVAEAERRVGRLAMPSGVSFVFTGEHEAKQAAQQELLLLGLAAGVGIVLLLWMAFGSVRILLLVLANLPFAVVGGVAAIYLTGGVLDVGGLIGFVTLFGITVRNSIMLVSHWQHLHEVEGMSWGSELVFRGARERLAPVLMTALVTGLGLLPIALGSGEAGREIEGPMALVILGGLATSTLLNLVVLPVLYRRFGVGSARIRVAH
jgi:CzcA family heavy metal efflux pump